MTEPDEYEVLEPRIRERVDRIIESAVEYNEYEPEFIDACAEVARFADEWDLAKWLATAMVKHYPLEEWIKEQLCEIVFEKLTGHPYL